MGTSVARQAIKAGYNVQIATSKAPEAISLLVEVIVPGAKAVTAAEAADADIVIVAVPLHKYRTVDPGLLAGKTVIDVMNYWSPVDGEVDDFEDDPRSSSEIVQAYFAKSQLVKTFNHLGYHELEQYAAPAGSPDRMALGLAGDSPEARAQVAQLIDNLGFDPVDAGPLATGRAFQPGEEIFNGKHTAESMRAILSAQPARV